MITITMHPAKAAWAFHRRNQSSSSSNSGSRAKKWTSPTRHRQQQGKAKENLAHPASLPCPFSPIPLAPFIPQGTPHPLAEPTLTSDPPLDAPAPHKRTHDPLPGDLPLDRHGRHPRLLRRRSQHHRPPAQHSPLSRPPPTRGPPRGSPPRTSRGRRKRGSRPGRGG